jgi:hypothetical protein
MKPFVHTLFRPLLGAAAALTLGLGAIAPASAPADPQATAQTTPATAVTDTAATLNGIVGPANGTTFYAFEYGTTTKYGSLTRVGSVPGSAAPSAVSAPLSGLTPATVYHFRLITGNGRAWRVGVGADQTFTTTPTPAALPPATAPIPAAPPVAAAAAPAPTPTLGKTVVVAPLSGTVKVKVPGGAGFTVLGAGGAVPTGATVDTRAGEVQLTTALPGGATQAAQFHGGVFRVRQSATGGGTTDIDLRGPALQCAKGGKARASAAAATKRKPTKRKLWGQDKGGRYRTHGANSVATVRGTRWITTDTCAGTRTTVTEGAVSVRDVRRKRSVLVRAGHSYLARTR